MKSYPIYLKQGAILVRVSAKGPKGIEEAELILDTGASQTIISKSVANTIGCGAKERSGYKAITTAKGIIDAEAYRIHSFKSLGLIRQNFEILVHDLHLAFSSLGIDGLLGLDFITKRRLTIDLREKHLLLS